MQRLTNASDPPFEAFANQVAAGTDSPDRTQRLVEHAESLRRIASVLASPTDRAQLERMATTYEALAYRKIRSKPPSHH